MTKQTTDVEAWYAIADQLQRVNAELHELQRLLNHPGNVPKSVADDELTRAFDALTKAQSDLQDRYAEEHPDVFDDEVFYGVSRAPERELVGGGTVVLESDDVYPVHCPACDSVVTVASEEPYAHRVFGCPDCGERFRYDERGEESDA